MGVNQNTAIFIYIYLYALKELPFRRNLVTTNNFVVFNGNRCCSNIRSDYIQMGGLCMTSGYIGKILEVDLNSGKLNDIPIDEKTARKFLGGKGLALKLYKTVLSRI